MLTEGKLSTVDVALLSLDLPLKDTLLKIAYEVQKATAKHPKWPTDVIHAAAIVGEESGELIRAALQFNYEQGEPEELRKEAIQTGAMAVRFLLNEIHY